MARKPVYGHNKGLARTTVNGKRIYLGTYNSPESKAAFEQIMADWEAAHAERSPTISTELTVSRLAVLFLKHAENEYRRDGVPTGETANFRHALQAMKNMFHGVRCIDFGPKKLKQLQQQMVKDGLAQQTINGRIRRIKQVFEWAVSEELVSVNVSQALRSVHGLRVGKTAARPPQPKGPVSIEAVKAIKPHVTTPMWAMIQFLLLTGCRPSEAVALRWSEIDTTKAVWIYCPSRHKTTHKGKNRIIVIGPEAQQVLHGIREMSRSDFVFDPQVGFEEFVRKAYGDKAKARKVGDCYTKAGLNASIRNACDKAKIPRWSPGQLRKTRGTHARHHAGLETAQQIHGHSSKQTTERHYAFQDLSLAEAYALQFG
ncbi:MAG: site-specific integrase [Planctomycetaceae bacterium]|nr:site-specific integrase [Planctomycetaceae bacterium]